MPTKIFILANQHSANFVLETVLGAWRNSKDGRNKQIITQNEVDINPDSSFNKYTNKHCFLFTNNQSFSESDFSNLIKSSNKDDAADKLFFFITPELFWGKSSADEGYEKALDIIKNKLIKDNHLPQIKFLSVVPYEVLKDKSSDSVKKMVESFPYLDLLDKQETLNKNLFTEYSKTHFSLLKRLIVSNAGYLGYVLHEISKVDSSSSPKESEDLKVVALICSVVRPEDLYKYSYAFDHREAYFQNVKKYIDSLIRNYELGSSNGEKSSYKVLIIEDDESYRNFMEGELKKYFKQVEIICPKKSQDFSEGLYEAVNEINNPDIIFLDLLFKKKNGSWSNINGLDVYDSIKKSFPYSLVCIVSSLPRTITESLVQEHVDGTYFVFTKIYGESFLAQNLNESVNNIINKTKELNTKIAKSKRYPIPANGVFRKHSAKLIEYLNGQEDKQRQEISNAIQYAFDRLALIKQGEDVDIELFNGGVKEHILISKLNHVFFCRLILLDYALDFSGEIICTMEELEEDNIIESVIDYHLKRDKESGSKMYQSLLKYKEDFTLKSSLINKWKEIFSRIKGKKLIFTGNGESSEKQNLNQLLGFNVDAIKDSSIELFGWKVGLKNLFQHEREFVVLRKVERNKTGQNLSVKEKQFTLMFFQDEVVKDFLKIKIEKLSEIDLKLTPILENKENWTEEDLKQIFTLLARRLSILEQLDQDDQLENEEWAYIIEAFDDKLSDLN